MNDNPFKNALILTGPTGSGKSALALELATRLNAEIISADSMTLYRGMNIGTAKPTLEDRSRIPHHLIDVLDPWESANVAWWLKRAKQCVADIEARGKLSLIVGGTPFYLKAILCGLFESPPANEELRRSLEAEATSDGGAALHRKLAAVDPSSAARLHSNDVRRVVRALEVWQLTGKPISVWQRESWWDGKPPCFASGTCLALDIPRQELYARINNRVTEMVAAGWVEEVRSLRLLPNPPGKEATQALGYREISRVVDGKCTIQDAISEIQLRTRQFAKRQLTWLRSLRGCVFCEPKLTFGHWTNRMSSSYGIP